ncbi:MAG: PAS domain S-box protein [Proteobacteria bacterium]|nr:PAS domain S-box protein [Pseudomonadota bacterium]
MVEHGEAGEAREARCAHAPLPTWELDLADVVRALVDEGISAAAAPGAAPALLVRCLARLRVVDANHAAVALFAAASRTQLLQQDAAGLSSTLLALWPALAALWIGDVTATAEATITTLAGEARTITAYVSCCPHATPLAQVILTAVDVTAQRRTDAAVRRKVQRQRLALAAGRVGTFEMDLATGEGEWSPEVAECWGMPPGFAGNLAAFCWDRLHPDDLARTQAEFAHAVAHNAPTDLEFRVVHADGTTRWIRWRGQVTHDGPGGAAHILGVNQDITARKLVEEALRASEQRFAVAFQASPTSSIIARADDGRIVSVNDTFVQSWGYAREEVLGRTALELGLYFTPGDREGVLASTATPVLREIVGVTKAGARIETLGGAAEITLDVRHVLMMGFDITARKRAEERLRLLWQAVDQSPVAIAIGAADGTIEYVNGRYLEITDVAREDLLGKHLLREGGLLPPETADEIAHVLAAGTPWRAELNRTHKQGSWVRVSLSPVRDATGKVSHLLGMGEDISERRRLEEAFRHAQKMEAFGQLAAGIAHDFNNLLAVMVGNLTFLAEQHDPLAVADIGDAVRRATNLTRQLLTFSARQPTRLELLDLNEVADDMTRMLLRLIGEHIKLTARLVPGAAWVRADRGMMEQVLANLVVNARDAMHAGGTLEVCTEVVELDAAATREAGRYVRLTVRDSGTGIAPEHLDRIFEPFFTTKAVGRGTGIGLATVFGIVEHHQGLIDVETVLGAGTAFKVHLPLVVAPPVVRAPPVELSSPHAMASKNTILVVEDEVPVRNLFRRILQKAGYHVLEATNGIEAIRIWDVHKATIDVLLTDMVMPGGLSGRDLATRMAAERADLKIIYASGYVPETVELAAHGDGVFLAKPFGAGELLRALDRLLRDA